jgi:predicted DNA-binding transcriptional regulator AlpA
VTRFPKLAGLAEVAGLAGVSRKRAWQLTQHPKFPAPVQELAATPVWRESDVQAFLATPRAAGRPKNAATSPGNP